MVKRNLRYKNTRKKSHLKNKGHSKRKTINKRHRSKTHKKMCVHCRCKVCKCNHSNKKKHKSCGRKSRSHKLRGGGDLNLHQIIPQDIRTAWENIGHGFQSLGHQFSGTDTPQSPSVVSQPYLENLKKPIPLRTNIQQSNAAATSYVNRMLDDVST